MKLLKTPPRTPAPADTSSGALPSVFSQASQRGTPVAVGGIVGERPPLVSEGVRELWFDDWMTSVMFGRPKLTLWFHLPRDGQEPWTRLARHYNVKELASKPGPRGLFRVGWKSDYLREYANYFDVPPDDDLNPARYEETRVWGEVKTVTTSSKRESLPIGLQYSVIAKLLPPVET